MFRGDTVRGLVLNAYDFGTLGTIAIFLYRYRLVHRCSRDRSRLTPRLAPASGSGRRAHPTGRAPVPPALGLRRDRPTPKAPTARSGLLGVGDTLAPESPVYPGIILSDHFCPVCLTYPSIPLPQSQPEGRTSVAGTGSKSLRADRSPS